MNVVIVEVMGKGEYGCTMYTCMSDAADDFGVTRTTMYRWSKKGLPKDGKGKRVYFNVEVVKSRNKKGSDNFK